VIVVQNCPTLDEVGPPRAPHDGPLRVLYHGSIVPARLPLTVIDAIAAVPDVTLVIAGYETVGHPGHVEALLSRARGLGVSDRVNHRGLVPLRRDLLEECASCDVGLALMPMESDDINEQAMAGASNKPFDYLARGLPLIVSDLRDWDLFVDA